MSDEISLTFERGMWYNNIAVQFEIIKALRNRELQVIGEGVSVRWLNAMHVTILRKHIDALNLRERPANWYCSLDIYRMIPMMSYHLGTRKEQSEEWNAGPRQKSVLGQDFGLDLDMKDGTWRDAITDAQALRDLFDGFGVRYAHWMSGEHGFHFKIPYEDMPEEVKRMQYTELLAFYKLLATELKKKVKSIDLVIYSPTRVLKCPYSLTKRNLVVLPLDSRSWERLRGGDEGFLRPLSVLNEITIRDRGLYLQGNTDGIKRFIKEWNGWEK